MENFWVIWFLFYYLWASFQIWKLEVKDSKENNPYQEDDISTVMEKGSFVSILFVNTFHGLYFCSWN